MAQRSLQPLEATSSSTPQAPEQITRLEAEDLSRNTIGRRITPGQRDAWRFYDLHGEVHYPMTIGGNLCGRVELGVQERRDGVWYPAKGREEGAALDQVTQIGLDDFFRSIWINTAIAGEGVMTVDKVMGQYSVQIFSNDEVYQESDGRWVRVDDMGRREYFDLGQTRVTRFWRPHPRSRRAADSGLHSVLNECRELELLKLALLAKITSRLASVGILFLPNSLSMPNPDPDAASGTLSGDPLVQMLIKLFMAPIRNPGSAAGAMPVILRGPDDVGEKIKHIVLDTSLDEVEEKHRIELRRAIANGLELPIETQTTITDANRWNAWNISESALRDHCLPVCRAGASLLTSRVLWPWLRSTGMSEPEVRNRRFWPDADKAALGLNRADMARQLYLLNELNPEALRDAHGFDESHAPTEVQVIRGLGVKLNIPAMAAYKMNVPPELLVAPSSPAPGPGGYNLPEAQVDSGSQVGNPNNGLDQS